MHTFINELNVRHGKKKSQAIFEKWYKSNFWENVETYQLNSYKIDVIRYWIREIKLGRTDLYNDAPRGKTADPAITTAIQVQIENNPMASARQIARALNISPTTVIDKLHNEHHYHCYLTRWVPHRLNDQQRKNRVDIANQMLDILRKNKGLISRIFTLEMSPGFYLNITNEVSRFCQKKIS